MKSLLRNFLIYAVALYLLPMLIPGFTINGGLVTIVFGSVALALMLFLVKPVLNLVSFPFNLITLGLFSVLTNVLILYLLTIFVPNISVSAFTFPGLTIAGFVIPKMAVSQFFAFTICAVMLSCIISSITWLMD